MTIHEELAANLKAAMKAKDKPQVNVIRQIESEVTLRTTAEGFQGEADDDLYVDVIAGYVKKMSKAKGEFEKAGERGAAQAAKLAYEVEYLSQWLPDKAADEDAARTAVQDALAELGVDDPKQMGRVMGHIMRNNDGLDGALVKQLLSEELGA